MNVSDLFYPFLIGIYVENRTLFLGKFALEAYNACSTIKKCVYHSCTVYFITEEYTSHACKAYFTQKKYTSHACKVCFIRKK